MWRGVRRPYGPSPGGGVTWQKVIRSYNANGDLTDDGVYRYRYNAFGQAVEIRRRAGARTSEAKFTYDPIGRLIQSAVSNSGVNHLDQDARARPDGGNRTLDYFYYGGRLLEVHNAFPATIAQHLYGPSGHDPIATYARSP